MPPANLFQRPQMFSPRWNCVRPEQVQPAVTIHAGAAGSFRGANRAADFFARDDTEFWRVASGQLVPVGDQAAERQPLALLPDAREIAALCKP